MADLKIPGLGVKALGGSVKSEGLCTSLVDEDAAYMEYDAGSGYARFGAKGNGGTASRGVKIRTLNSGSPVDAIVIAPNGTSSLQAVTLTGATISTSGVSGLLAIDTTAGNTTDSAEIAFKRNTVNKWLLGNNVATGGDAFDIYASGSGLGLSINYTTRLVTLPAGLIVSGTSSLQAVTATSLAIASGLTFQSDNSFDIGASGANRPRNIYVAGTATIGGNVYSGGQISASLSGVSTYGLYITHGASGTGPQGMYVGFTQAAPNNTSNYFLYTGDNAAARALIYSNGGIANYQANNVNLSDERTKNIGETIDGAYASRVMANLGRANVWLRYQYKDQTHGDDNLGTTAQRLYAALPDELRPSLVDTEGWTEKDGSSRWSVFETDISYLTRAAVSHHANVIDRHASEIVELRQRIDTLEGELGALRKAV